MTFAYYDGKVSIRGFDSRPRLFFTPVVVATGALAPQAGSIDSLPPDRLTLTCFVYVAAAGSHSLPRLHNGL